MKLTIALFSIIFGLCLAQETKINWILKDSTLRTRCTLNMETSVLECDGAASTHVKCNVKHNMTLVVPMKFEHFAIEYTPVEGTEIPTTGLFYHLYPRQMEKNLWFSYNVTIPTIGEVSMGLFYQLPIGFGIEIVDQVCASELFKLLQASTEHEEILVEGGVSESMKVMVIGEIVIVPGSVIREDSDRSRWSNGGSYGRHRGGRWREADNENSEAMPMNMERMGMRSRELDNEDSDIWRNRYGGFMRGGWWYRDMSATEDSNAYYRPRYWRYWREGDNEDSDRWGSRWGNGRPYAGYRRWREADNEDSDLWYGPRWGYGHRRWREADNEDSERRYGYGGRYGGYRRWRGSCQYQQQSSCKREIYKYYRESMSTGDLALRTKCELRNESSLIECVGPVETVVCDIVSNFTGLGTNLFELYGIGEPVMVNGEVEGFYLYPRTLDNKQFINYIVPAEGKDVSLHLFQKEDITKFGIRVETPECFHRLHSQFKLALKPEEILINNTPVKLVGEVLV